MPTSGQARPVPGSTKACHQQHAKYEALCNVCLRGGGGMTHFISRQDWHALPTHLISNQLYTLAICGVVLIGLSEFDSMCEFVWKLSLK